MPLTLAQHAAYERIRVTPDELPDEVARRTVNARLLALVREHVA